MLILDCASALKFIFKVNSKICYYNGYDVYIFSRKYVSQLDSNPKSYTIQ